MAAELASGQICPELFASATNPVPGEGDPDAEVMFIGEAPGAKEDQTGTPFVGAAGRFLDAMLNSIELSRERVFITSIVKFRPPENRDPTPQEISESLPLLRRQIEIIQPQLIVLLGRHAMNVFLPGAVISQAHGRPVEQDGQLYLPLFHPAAALHNGGLRQTLMDDFQNIPKILKQIEENEHKN